MRPQKFRMIVNSGIARWLNNRDSRQLVSALPEMKRVWSKWAKEEGDLRSGAETYGYENAESVENNMMYISDRWRCAFRLRWIIDGLENGNI